MVLILFFKLFRHLYDIWKKLAWLLYKFPPWELHFFRGIERILDFGAWRKSRDLKVDLGWLCDHLLVLRLELGCKDALRLLSKFLNTILYFIIIKQVSEAIMILKEWTMILNLLIQLGTWLLQSNLVICACFHISLIFIAEERVPSGYLLAH